MTSSPLLEVSTTGAAAAADVDVAPSRPAVCDDEEAFRLCA